MGGVLDAEKLQTLPDVLNTSKSFDAATQAGYRSEWRGEKRLKPSAHGKGNG